MRIVDEILRPLSRGFCAFSPDQLFHHLSNRTRIFAIQAGEPGPFAQAIAGIDTAFWDIFARRRKQPLWRMMGGSHALVPVYTSGISTGMPEEIEQLKPTA